MTPDSKKKLLAATWIIAIMAIALVGGIGSLMGWLLTGVVAFGPAAAVLHFSKEPAPTTSESINSARR
jgi:hypothetical protein